MRVYDTYIRVHDDNFVCATDLLKAGNKYRTSKGAARYTFQNLTKTKEATRLIDRYGADTCIRTIRGRAGHTMIHPALAFMLAHNLGGEILKQLKDKAPEQVLSMALGWGLFVRRQRVDSDIFTKTIDPQS